MKYADNTYFSIHLPLAVTVRYILPLIHFPNTHENRIKESFSFLHATPLAHSVQKPDKSLSGNGEKWRPMLRSRIDNPARAWHPALTGNGPRFWREMRGALFSLLNGWGGGLGGDCFPDCFFCGRCVSKALHFIFSESHELEKSRECNGLVYK